MVERYAMIWCYSAGAGLALAVLACIWAWALNVTFRTLKMTNVIVQFYIDRERKKRGDAMFPG